METVNQDGRGEEKTHPQARCFLSAELRGIPKTNMKEKLALNPCAPPGPESVSKENKFPS